MLPPGSEGIPLGRTIITVSSGASDGAGTHRTGDDAMDAAVADALYDALGDHDQDENPASARRPSGSNTDSNLNSNSNTPREAPAFVLGAGEDGVGGVGSNAGGGGGLGLWGSRQGSMQSGTARGGSEGSDAAGPALQHTVSAQPSLLDLPAGPDNTTTSAHASDSGVPPSHTADPEASLPVLGAAMAEPDAELSTPRFTRTQGHAQATSDDASGGIGDATQRPSTGGSDAMAASNAGHGQAEHTSSPGTPKEHAECSGQDETMGQGMGGGSSRQGSMGRGQASSGLQAGAPRGSFSPVRGLLASQGSMGLTHEVPRTSMPGVPALELNALRNKPSESS